MRGQLGVRVVDGARERVVTRFVKGLSFTKTAPGGHHSASINIETPANFLGDLGPADRVFIYDGRTARTTWEGYVQNPGRSRSLGGDAFSLSALGGLVLASDNGRPVVFVDRTLDHPYWRFTGFAASASLDRGQNFGDIPGIRAQWPSGTNLPTGAKVIVAKNSLLEATSQPLDLALSIITGGKGDATYRAGYLDLSSPALNTTPTFNSLRAGVDFTFDGTRRIYSMSLVHSAGSPVTVADDVTYAMFTNVVTAAALRQADGTYVIRNLSTTRADWVVSHLIGDGFLNVDPSTAVIEAASVDIDQLAYLDAVKPSKILDDLELYEPDMLWEFLESNAAGKHRFNYRAWPTTPRYEIDGRSFAEAGGEVGLANRIAVNWTDVAGVGQTTIRTTSVPELGGRIKDADPITLPDGLGSFANASRIGDEILQSLNTPSRSGSAVIAEPIFDRLARKTVMPWEIEPGYLVRVRDQGLDLRLTEMTYSDDSVAASITLGSPILSLDQRIARLGRAS